MRFEAGLVFFPAIADYRGVLENELFSFPNALHDDTVDCVSYACEIATRIAGAPSDSGAKQSKEQEQSTEAA